MNHKDAYNMAMSIREGQESLRDKVSAERINTLATYEMLMGECRGFLDEFLNQYDFNDAATLKPLNDLSGINVSDLLFGLLGQRDQLKLELRSLEKANPKNALTITNSRIEEIKQETEKLCVDQRSFSDEFLRIYSMYEGVLVLFDLSNSDNPHQSMRDLLQSKPSVWACIFDDKLLSLRSLINSIEKYDSKKASNFLEELDNVLLPLNNRQNDIKNEYNALSKQRKSLKEDIERMESIPHAILSDESIAEELRRRTLDGMLAHMYIIEERAKDTSDEALRKACFSYGKAAALGKLVEGLADEEELSHGFFNAMEEVSSKLQRAASRAGHRSLTSKAEKALTKASRDNATLNALWAKKAPTVRRLREKCESYRYDSSSDVSLAWLYMLIATDALSDGNIDNHIADHYLDIQGIDGIDAPLIQNASFELDLSDIDLSEINVNSDSIDIGSISDISNISVGVGSLDTSSFNSISSSSYDGSSSISADSSSSMSSCDGGGGF